MPEKGGGATSPYPGLRPFNRDEAHLFYGRDNSVEAMIGTLEETRFLAVLGPSGSGKSSLVRSGLFIHLEAGLARKAGSRWTFLDIRHPRQQPYRELARQLLREERRLAGDKGGASPADEEAVETRRKELRKDPLTLVNWWLEHRPHTEENLLLLVDQFEELFGYGEASERDDVEAFVDLLQQSTRYAQVPVYIVLTMRSEFLGGCTLFPGLAEQINRSLNLVPRMTRRECELAITGPVDGEALRLEPLLVTTLLNDMNRLAAWTEEEGGAAAEAQADAADPAAAMLRQADLIARRADQLPLMQHALNWMWRIADSKRERPGEPILLTLVDYDSLGGLAGALSRHAREVMEATGDPELTEKLFRALTDQPSVSSSGSAESSAVRRPRTIRQLAEEAGRDEQSVRAVVEPFRADGVSMLTPDLETPLTSDTEVDISHESLIRQWSDLRGWIRGEAERGRAWRELVRNVEQEGKKEAELLRGLGLSDRRRWWTENAPHSGWADRYGGQFEPVDAFLKRSVAAERRRKALGYGLTGALVLLATAAGAFSLAANRSAYEASRKAERSEALAQRAEGQALYAARIQRDARAAAAMANAQARNAQLQMAAARRAEQAARQAAQAAQAQARQAAVAVAQAVAQRASVEGQRQAITRATLDLTNDYIRPAIRQASSGPPETAQRLLEEMRRQAQPLIALSPLEFSDLGMDVRLERAELAAAGLDAPAMALAVAEMEEEAERQDAPPLRALMLSQANAARGRMQLLELRYADALATFTEAETLSTSGGPTPGWTSRAKSNAQLGRSQALLGAGDREGAAAAASACLATLNSGDAEPFDSRLIKAQCLIALSAASPAGDARTQHLDEAAVNIQQLESERGGSADILRLRLDLALQVIGSDGSELGSPKINAALGPLEEVLFGRRQGNRLASGSGALVDPRLFSLDGLMAIQVLDLFAESSLSRDRRRSEPTLRRNGSSGETNSSVVRPSLDRFVEESLYREGLLFSYVAGRLNHGERGEGREIALRISALFARHTARWIDQTLPAGDPDFAMRRALAIAALIEGHEAILRRMSGNGVGEARAGVRALAVRLVAGLQVHADDIRYPDLPMLADAIDQMTTALCTGGGVGPDLADCGTAGVEGRRFVAESRARIRALDASAQAALRLRSVAQVWHQLGIALGGFDPVSCAAALAGPADNATGDEPDMGNAASFDEGNAASFDDGAAMNMASTNMAELPMDNTMGVADTPPPVEDNCRLRRGRYAFADEWDGRIWLFESAANLRTFRDRREAFVPQFAGYDAFSVQEDAMTLSRPRFIYGGRVQGLFYLFGFDPSALIFDVRIARENWRLGASAHLPPPEPAPNR